MTVHRMERNKFDTYGEALAFLNQFLEPVLANNWYLRAADLGYEVDYDTKKGQWYSHVRWAEIDKDKLEVEYPTRLPSIGAV